ncbi:heparinase II/III family protein [Pontiellaceae bacterium B12219]|nr:heparinase II/III family protein [Pontiellaceae bacterium B12219]
MKKNDIGLSVLTIVCMVLFNASAAPAVVLPELDNPMSVEYLGEHLAAEHPRLVYTPAILADLKAGIGTDPVLENLYAAVRLNGDQILEEPLLKRKMVDRRLLGVSREMLYRVNMLGVVYLVEGDPLMLERLNEEVLAVCAFRDWNPSHFLDVAEMSMAVALALDWTDGHLPDTTVESAKTALIEKGLRPSWPEDGSQWSRAFGENNWNQVCNGGLIAAAIAVAEEEPELASKTIHRALEGMPHALVQYAPDGVYPEGSTYWGYGTGFSVVTLAMFESAFGTDFGMAAVPGFMESAMFRVLCNAPSGMYFNFADCGDRRSENGDILLAWFAAKTGNSVFFERDRLLRPAREMGKLNRIDGVGLAWVSQVTENGGAGLPSAWKGDGENPIAIFTGESSNGYYFGGKGGKATTSHGNMDAGSFVFELNGVRWVIDPGNQSYNALEKTGFNLWSRSQNSERWTLLTKNNFGHSTVTVNDEPFVVDGFAPLIDFKEGEQPEAAFDLSAVYGKNIKSATRRFIKDGPASLIIQDRFQTLETTRKIVWQLMTTAEVEPTEDGAVLRQDGQTLNLKIRSQSQWTLSVVSLDPPPLRLDRQIDGLKRIEINIPVSSAVDGALDFEVRLTEGK